MIGIRPILPVPVVIALGVVLLVIIALAVFVKPLRRRSTIRRIGILTLLFVIFLRPVIYGVDAERVVSNLNVFFVVDNSGSMATKDMQNDSEYRFQMVSDDVKQLVETFHGARYSIIALDYDVYQILPMTVDAKTASEAANTIYPRYTSATVGSEMGELLNVSTSRISSYNASNHDRQSVVFIMSDGEDTFEDKTSVPKDLSSEIIGGAVIGYGTQKGGYVHRVDQNNALLKDEYAEERDEYSNLNKHLSVINEENLKNIADKAGVKYIRRDDISELSKKADDYLTVNTSFLRDKYSDGFFDIYWIVALLMLGLLLWELGDVASKLLLERKAVK